MRVFPILAPAILGLSACATGATTQPADSCKAAPGQTFIGRGASSSVGAELLAISNSREIRWVAPDMIVTADYKYGRLTVGYDQDRRITNISCG
jgi:hypothetical protein